MLSVWAEWSQGKGLYKEEGKLQQEAQEIQGKVWFLWKKGHTVKDCWQRDAKRGMKDQEIKNDTAAVEILIMANKLAIIEDPGVWIADTASAVHTTPY